MIGSNEPVCPCCGGVVSPLDLLFHDQTRTITYAGGVVKLPATQYRFAKALLDAYPRVLSRHDLMDALYPNPDMAPGIKVIDVVACHLRKRLDPLGLVIATSWGVGFSIEMSEAGKAALLRNRRFQESRNKRSQADDVDLAMIRVYRSQGCPITDIARRMGLTFRAVIDVIDVIDTEKANAANPALRRVA